MKSNNKREEILENVQRVVVKVGTSTLTTEDGRLNIDKIKKIVMELSNLQNKGYDVILVTSGAVGAGMGLLNINEKPFGSIKYYRMPHTMKNNSSINISIKMCWNLVSHIQILIFIF